MSRDDFYTEIIGPSAPPPSGTRRRRLRRAVLAALLIIVLAAAGLLSVKALRSAQDARPGQTAVSDYSGTGHGSVVVTIPEDASGDEIARILTQAGVVATADAFTQAYAANVNASSIQAGTYTLRLGMSAANAVAALLDPASRADHTLTIPEGSTRDQVKERLMSVGGFSEAEVETAFADAQAIGLPETAGGQVEGWLAPSTYDIAEDATATDVVATMVSLTLSRLTRLGVEPADYQQVLTKASVVEHEVASSTYYGQVARVIENRLADTDGETAGRLQMDSTALYGLGRTGGILTSDEMLDKSNPYNTYEHAGLPPTPISSPGEAALAAVVDPPQGQWLYFVTVNPETGETLFASTPEEQQANTERLMAYCEEHEAMCSTGSGS
ncbi:MULTISPECIES: endolytic transglycosylase MltG [unclassified Actinomyces]|uniref:endolytic transglycosylase MltG n=1 Tax=unclassified Actinomyces TaxID=2609248 RepID=UPI002016B33D|nr:MULTISPECIES: endolytic transglycosylase MltG [unclassified Actinomyces]MCL3778322.1 endolytic transglycosylase MltG [Actinomyces sp. AC-20-1]MCL3789215.1 endolytic transglycosylase MltG [Actinomyces sp. 187325]MCL3791402.1 endolytic transglycosylase MltG [Actinomyces sp. 186855]MCL3793573.1 endolytic transglycosylase MltG [Actinomyces sp. 217892]